jgi:hypothetical protein
MEMMMMMMDLKIAARVIMKPNIHYGHDNTPFLSIS